MPKKTPTAAGSVGDGMPVKVPVSVTTVWAEALASESAARKSAARGRIALRLRAALLDMLLDMEMVLSGLGVPGREMGCQRGHGCFTGCRTSRPFFGGAALSSVSANRASVSEFWKFIK